MSALIYPRKVKVADPKLIFGWQSSDDLHSIAPYTAHPTESKITNYKTIGLSPITGYVQSVNAGYVKTGPEEAPTKINSDALFPPGSRATMFLMEYEAFDQFTNEWVWVPSTSILDYDAIWVKRSDGYALSGLFTEPSVASPRSARVRRVRRQVRREDWSWTPPVDVPPSNLLRYESGRPAGSYSDLAGLPVWSVPSDSNVAGFGEAPAFVVLDTFSKLLQPTAMKPPSLGAEIEPPDQRTAVILAGGSMTAGNKLWAGNESVTQLCSELLRMIHPVRY